MDCEEKIQKISKKHFEIYQGYLAASRGISLRIRKSRRGNVVKSKFVPRLKGEKYYLTFKSSVNGGSRVVEIEKRIDARDFNDLWPQSMNKLVKIRYLVDDWEIDFFKDHNDQNYFAMAELELPENEVPPCILPYYIKDNLLYEVPLTDCRFSSKLLGDVRYAKEMYKKTLKGEK